MILSNWRNNLPLYTFINKDTGEERDEMMSVSERDEFLAQNENFTQKLSVPSFVDPVRLGVTRPDNGFKEAVQKVQEAHPINEINI